MKHTDLRKIEDLLQCAVFHICNDNAKELQYLVDEYGLDLDDRLADVSLPEVACRTGAAKCFSYMASQRVFLDRPVSNDDDMDRATKKNMLMIAAGSGAENAEKIVEQILKLKIFDIDEQEPASGKTALMFGAEKCTEYSTKSTKKVVAVLKKHKANLAIKNNDGLPAMYQIGNGAGSPEMFKELIPSDDPLKKEKIAAVKTAFGMDYTKLLKQCDEIGDSDFTVFCQKITLLKSCGGNDYDPDLAKQIMADLNGDIVYGGSKWEENPIGRMVVFNHVELFNDAMQYKPIISNLNDHGGTYLHTAAIHGCAEMCETLADNDLNVNYLDFYDNRPCQYSHNEGYHKTTKSLLDKGSEYPYDVASYEIIEELIAEDEACAAIQHG